MTRQVLRVDHVRHVIAQARGLTPGRRVVAIDGRQDMPDELWVTVDAGDSLVANDSEAHPLARNCTSRRRWWPQVGEPPYESS